MSGKKPADKTSDDAKKKISSALNELQGLSEDAATQWIASNAGGFSDSELYSLIVAAGEHGYVNASVDGLTKSDPALGKRFSGLQENRLSLDLYTGVDAEPVDLEQLARDRLAANTGPASLGTDLTNDGTTAPAERAAIAKVTQEAGAANAKAKGTDSASEAAAAASTFKDDNGDPYAINDGVAVPDWVRSAYGGSPSRADTNNLIKEWNATHPASQVSSPEDLWGKLKNGANADNSEIVSAAINGRDPIIQQIYKVPARGAVPGVSWSSGAPGHDVAVNQDAFKIANGLWGANPQVLGEIVRMASRANLLTGDGKDVAWQPLASLYKMTLDSTAPKSDVNLGTHGLPGSQVADKASRAQVLANLAIKYKEGLGIYGNDATLAALYASGNKTLVDRMVMAKGGYLDAGDAMTAKSILARGGWNTTDLAAAGYQTASPWFDNIVGSTANAYGGLADQQTDRNQNRADYVQTNKADPETIKQSVKDMWQELFAADPSDKITNAISARIDALVTARAEAGRAPAGGGDTTNVATDVNAEVLAAARASGDYKKFYGNKPTGMSDAQYRGQFDAGAADMLGNQAADPSAIRGGLATGDYQTTIGEIAGSKAAMTNSRYQQRLSQAAIAINEVT